MDQFLGVFLSYIALKYPMSLVPEKKEIWKLHNMFTGMSYNFYEILSKHFEKQKLW